MQRNRAQKAKITESTSPENAQTVVTSSEKGERSETASDSAGKGREKTEE